MTLLQKIISIFTRPSVSAYTRGYTCAVEFIREELDLYNGLESRKIVRQIQIAQEDPAGMDEFDRGWVTALKGELARRGYTNEDFEREGI